MTLVFDTLLLWICKAECDWDDLISCCSSIIELKFIFEWPCISPPCCLMYCLESCASIGSFLEKGLPTSFGKSWPYLGLFYAFNFNRKFIFKFKFGYFDAAITAWSWYWLRWLLRFWLMPKRFRSTESRRNFMDMSSGVCGLLFDFRWFISFVTWPSSVSWFSWGNGVSSALYEVFYCTIIKLLLPSELFKN